MRPLCLLTLPLVFFTVLSGCSTTSSTRSDLFATMRRLAQSGTPLRQPEEYGSIAAALARGEALRELGEEELAERYYRLALTKAFIMERQVLPLPKVNEEVPPAAVGRQDPEEASADEMSAPPPMLPEIIPPVPVADEPAAPVSPPPATVFTDKPVRSGKTAPRAGSSFMAGGEIVYTVKRGDTLRGISSRFGVNWRHVAARNRLGPEGSIRTGQKLRITTRKIVPKALSDGLVINIADRTLYHFKKEGLVATVPIAVGKPRSGSRRGWETPTGMFTVKAKLADPVWSVPLSIQKEMEEQGKTVVRMVPPGPDNPLGKYAIRTSIPGIFIHGTNVPQSIYGFTSHGCIRVLPELMETLYRQLEVNARGEIIYQPVKAMVSPEGRVFLEVHRDAYRRVPDLDREVREILKGLEVTEYVDWVKVENLLREQSGVAEDVSL